MSATPTQISRKPCLKPGMTLLELTVVILVIFSLISLLIVGASAWKRGSDRAACLLNIRNVHHAVRSKQNLYGKEPGDALNPSDIVGNDAFIVTSPSCPSNGVYTLSQIYPAIGTAALTCDNATILNHVPSNTTDW